MPVLMLSLGGGTVPCVADVFIPVADTSTQTPGGTGTFTAFAPDTAGGVPTSPSISHGTVAFYGRTGTNQSGIYLWNSESLATVADQTTSIPQGTGKFSGFNSPSVSGSNVAFFGFGTAGGGIYLSTGGGGTPLSRVADRSMTPPGETKAFAGFRPPSITGTDVYFAASTTGIGESGVYGVSGGTVRTIADQHTTIPGTSSTFSALTQSLVVARAGRVVFLWDSPTDLNQQGVYTLSGNALVPIADHHTTAPSGLPFHGFSNFYVGFDGTTASFAAEYGHSWSLVLGSGGAFHEVLATGDPAPGGGQFDYNYGNDWGESVDDGQIAFDVSGTIYSDFDGPLRRVVGRGDTLMGKTVDAAFMGSDGLSDGQITFGVRFTNQSTGIFVVPEPLWLSVFAGALLLPLRRRRSRRAATDERPAVSLEHER